jgi:hypothetical protein
MPEARSPSVMLERPNDFDPQQRFAAPWLFDRNQPEN